jgi:hypothetical protein
MQIVQNKKKWLRLFVGLKGEKKTLKAISTFLPFRVG